MWYYSANNQQLGPVSEEQLKAMARSSSLSSQTLVWKEGMSDWKALGEVAELAISLSAPVAENVTSDTPIAQSLNPYSTPQTEPIATRPISTFQQPMPYINSGGYRAFAIVSTIMCCWPFGIVAIVYAAQINSKIAAGDYFGALDSAKKSKMWSWIAVGSIGIILVIYFLLIALGLATSSLN